MNSSTPAGLIEVPELSGARKGALVLAIFVFLMSLALTGLTDWLVPLEIPKLKGDEKTRQAQLRANSNWLDGSLARRIENDQRLRSPMRRRVLPVYGWFLYKQLSEAKNLYIGKDGWLFLPERARAPRDSGQTVGEAVNYLAALQRLLFARGTRLVVAPIPRKSVLLEQMLPQGVRPNRGVEERLIRDLLASGVTAANLLEVLESADPLEMFYFADPHWTPAAENLAAEEIARVAGIWLSPEERDTELRKSGKFQFGFNLFSWIGAEGSPGVKAFLQSHLHDKYEVYPIASEIHLSRDNPEKPCRIGLVGTSFTAHRAMRVLLRHFSGEEIWNAGQAGIGPIRPLRKYLQSLQGDVWPELLLLEFPVDQIIGEVGLSEVVQVCADWATPGAVIGPGWEAWESELGQTSRDQKYKPLARLPAGLVAHSGDGTLSILLERELADQQRAPKLKRMQLAIGGEMEDFFWEKGKRTIVLPLVASNHDAGELSLFLAQSRRIQLKSIQIVHTLPLRLLAQAVPQPRLGHGAGIEFGFQGLESVPSQGALQILGGPWPAGGKVEFELVFDAPGQATRSFAFDSLVPGAPVVLGLQGWAGRRIRALRIRSELSMPGISKAEVQLLGPSH